MKRPSIKYLGSIALSCLVIATPLSSVGAKSVSVSEMHTARTARLAKRTGKIQPTPSSASRVSAPAKSVIKTKKSSSSSSMPAKPASSSSSSTSNPMVLGGNVTNQDVLHLFEGLRNAFGGYDVTFDFDGDMDVDVQDVSDFRVFVSCYTPADNARVLRVHNTIYSSFRANFGTAGKRYFDFDNDGDNDVSDFGHVRGILAMASECLSLTGNADFMKLYGGLQSAFGGYDVTFDFDMDLDTDVNDLADFRLFVGCTQLNAARAQVVSDVIMSSFRTNLGTAGKIYFDFDNDGDNDVTDFGRLRVLTSVLGTCA